ncbi:MAG TPA: hypothetical protein VHB25_14530 [Gemmatimonadaceae bacterium]|nr:hypothetical protein [Gemmatimonadaceae bacterium]
MNKALALAALLLGAACTHDTAEPTGPTPNLSATVTRGALTLKVQDFATNPGIFWALPSIVSSPSTISIQSTQYGNLCRESVDGGAAVTGSHVTLDVTFTDKPDAVCSAEIRALRYTADIAAPAGTYDVTVVHHDGARADTLVKQRTIVVP